VPGQRTEPQRDNGTAPHPGENDPRAVDRAGPAGLLTKQRRKPDDRSCVDTTPGWQRGLAEPPFEQMDWIPGGPFLMGSNDFYPKERPVHRATSTASW